MSNHPGYDNLPDGCENSIIAATPSRAFEPAAAITNDYSPKLIPIRAE